MSDEWLDKLEFDVDKTFTRQELRELLSNGNDPRLARIDRVINDAYEEAIRWHNARIAEGTDPRSGLRSLPYIPWDERIDGTAASMAAYAPGSYERNGDPRYAYGYAERRRGLTCAEWLIIATGVLACAALLIMFW